MKLLSSKIACSTHPKGGYTPMGVWGARAGALVARRRRNDLKYLAETLAHAGAATMAQ